MIVQPFRRGHLKHFEPGEPERALWLDPDMAREMRSAMVSNPTVTLLSGGVPVAFVGAIRKPDDWYVWSMWSRQARERPLVLLRWLRRHAVECMRAHGISEVAVLCERAGEVRLADWLGISGDGPVRRWRCHN